MSLLSPEVLREMDEFPFEHDYKMPVDYYSLTVTFSALQLYFQDLPKDHEHCHLRTPKQLAKAQSLHASKSADRHIESIGLPSGSSSLVLHFAMQDAKRSVDSGD